MKLTRRSRGNGPQTVVAAWLEELRAHLASDDEARIDAAVRDYLQLRRAVEAMLSPEIPRDQGRPIELATGAQSRQYMIDLLPHLQRHLAQFPRGHVFDVLDVGPGSGHGAALLSTLYATSELGYRLRLTAVDIADTYRRYIAATAPYLRFKVDDVYTMEQKFDIVISSHVIEHVQDPIGFCRRLQELARECVFIVAPFNEPADNLTAGHVNVIDDGFVAELGANEITVMSSVAWGAFHDPPYEMVIAKLPARGADVDG